MLVLRHPTGKPIRAVEVNGVRSDAWNGEAVHLRPTGTRMVVTVSY